MPRWLPHPIVLLIVVLGVLLFAAFLVEGAVGLRTTTGTSRPGELIANGQFPRTDPYSFTWFGMPWTLHEWLSELLIFQLVDSIGYMGAVYVFALIPGITIGILAFAFHRLGLRTAAIIGSTSLSALLVIPYATHPAAGDLVDLLRDPDRRARPSPARPISLDPGACAAVRAVGEPPRAVGHRPRRTCDLRGPQPGGTHADVERKTVGRRMVPIAMLGTIFTPEGPALLVYPLRYIDSGDWGMANITEWQSPDFHDPAHYPLLIYMAAVAIFGRWRVPWWMSIMAFLGIAMTLIALRNGAVAAIIGAPALAVGMDAALRDWRPNLRVPSPRIARQRRMLELGLGSDRRRRWHPHLRASRPGGQGAGERRARAAGPGGRAPSGAHPRWPHPRRGTAGAAMCRQHV